MLYSQRYVIRQTAASGANRSPGRTSVARGQDTPFRDSWILKNQYCIAPFAPRNWVRALAHGPVTCKFASCPWMKPRPGTMLPKGFHTMISHVPIPLPKRVSNRHPLHVWRKTTQHIVRQSMLDRANRGPVGLSFMHVLCRNLVNSTYDRLRKQGWFS
jgi:hypothetical protein